MNAGRELQDFISLGKEFQAWIELYILKRIEIWLDCNEEPPGFGYAAYCENVYLPLTGIYLPRAGQSRVEYIYIYLYTSGQSINCTNRFFL